MKKIPILIAVIIIMTGCSVATGSNSVKETTAAETTESVISEETYTVETTTAETTTVAETSTIETTTEATSETTEETEQTTVAETTTVPVTTTTAPVTTTTVTTTTPVTTTTITTTTPAPISFDDYAYRVYEIVNEERKAAGLSPLGYNSELCKMASIRAEEISRSFSHDRPDGSSCFSIFDEYGYRYYCVGENIAAGYSNPEHVMDGWMNSSGHRANILNSDFGNIGVGVYKGDGWICWVQLFSD